MATITNVSDVESGQTPRLTPIKAIPTSTSKVGVSVGSPMIFSIGLENSEILAQWLNINVDFYRQAESLFLQTVFQIHKYLIRISPVDTGEVRGGWTAVLNKYRQDYTVAMTDFSLYDSWKQGNKTPEGREYHFAWDQVSKGANQSQFEEAPMDITVINSVPQAEYMETGTGKIQARETTELARYKGEYFFNEIFNDWFEDIAKEGKVTQPKSVLETQLS